MNQIKGLTHDELVARAVRWLAGTNRCGVVFNELVTSADSIPDAIGWRTGGHFSILVECKVSLSDFYADRSKPHVKLGRTLGDLRYYMTPPGLIKPELLSPGWGLVEVHGGRCKKIVEAEQQESDKRQELALFYSAAHRWAHQAVRVFAVPEAEMA